MSRRALGRRCGNLGGDRTALGQSRNRATLNDRGQFLRFAGQRRDFIGQCRGRARAHEQHPTRCEPRRAGSADARASSGSRWRRGEAPPPRNPRARWAVRKITRGASPAALCELIRPSNAMPSMPGMLMSLMASRMSGLAAMSASACSPLEAVTQENPFAVSTELTSSRVGGSSSIARIRIFDWGCAFEPAGSLNYDRVFSA